MKLKAIGSLLLASIMGIGLTSCLGEPKSESAFNIKVSNMIFPDDLGEEVRVDHDCTYNIKLDGVKNNLVVSTSSLSLNGYDNLSFTSDPMDVMALSGPAGQSGTFARGTAKLSNGTPVSDINGYYTSIVYYYEVLGDPYPVALINPMLVMNYRAGNATVRTFSTDSFFQGQTTTTYSLAPGSPEKNFITKDAVYRIIFNRDMKTANVVIYNVQFAEEMNKKLQAVVLQNLPVTLTHQGYEIFAKDVVPQMLESAGLTPYDRYKFDKIDIRNSNAELTAIKCNYTVAGSFKGVFEGYCVNKYDAAI